MNIEAQRSHSCVTAQHTPHTHKKACTLGFTHITKIRKNAVRTLEELRVAGFHGLEASLQDIGSTHAQRRNFVCNHILYVCMYSIMYIMFIK
jgi:hypothetical protein